LGPVRAVIPLVEIMRLTRPISAGGPPVVASPVEVGWEPVQGASSYHVAIMPDDDVVKPHVEPLRAVVQEPAWRADVPAGTWAVDLTAVGDRDEVLGTLTADRAFVVR